MTQRDPLVMKRPRKGGVSAFSTGFGIIGLTKLRCVSQPGIIGTLQRETLLSKQLLLRISAASVNNDTQPQGNFFQLIAIHRWYANKEENTQFLLRKLRRPYTVEPLPHHGEAMRGLKSLVAAVGLTLTSVAASEAQPVYLTCKLQREDGVARWDFVLNEATNKVTMSFPRDGTSESGNGIFTADEVSFTLNRGEVIEEVYTINRVNLTFTRSMPAIKSTEKGKCIVGTPPKNRKF
jgi:hypothetical protein